jgi:hypothetical protein
MSNTSNHIADKREILLVGPYGVSRESSMLCPLIPRGESPQRRDAQSPHTG